MSPSILGKRVTQAEYDKATSADKKADAARASGNVAAKDAAVKDFSSVMSPSKKSSSRGSSPITSTSPTLANLNQPTSLGSGQVSATPPAPEPSSGFTPDGVMSAGEKIDPGFVQNLRDAKDKLGAPTAGQVTAFGALISSIASFGLAGVANAGAAAARTAVSDSLIVGAAPVVEATSVAGSVATNTATVATTTNWFLKLGATIGVASLLKEAIGSYPFAGFLKEEALQTGSFAVKSAIDAGNYDDAEAGLALQKEMLNPSLWSKIKGAIPYANVLSSLNEFYDAAALKVAVDEQIVADLRTKTESGQSDSEFYASIAEERLAQRELERQSDADYYAEVERQRLAAKLAERKADEEYWSKIAADKLIAEAEKRKADEEYWSAYYKRLSELRTPVTSTSASKGSSYEPPSKLNFGLLG
jgi:hypothetical protein